MNMSGKSSSAFWIICLIFGLSAGQLEGKALGEQCTSGNCRLPDCFCSGTSIPGGLSADSIPQIIMMSFDDAVNEQVSPFYQKLFSGETKNPNNCNIGATFFVSHEYTRYDMIQNLYHDRHEIADHTISHRLPISWWKSANYSQWNDEISGQREILRKWGQVNLEDVHGFRAPFLQIGGNTEFKVLHDLKFTFEASMPTQHFMNPPMWPYTLDYQSKQECVIPPCPTDSYPGLWEVPMVDYRDLRGQPCNMIDDCSPPANQTEAYQLLEENFKRHYTSTSRAPFPMFMHAVWFQKYPFTVDAMHQFLQDKVAMGDVYVVTISQAIEWIRSPTTLKYIKDFKPWKCDSPAPPACPSQDVNVCHYNEDKNLVPPDFPDVEHYFFTCTKPCPVHYPWVGNPDGN